MLPRRNIVVKTFLAHPEARLPVQGSSEAAGFDLHSCEDCFLEPGGTIIVSTGLVLCPEPGWRIDIRSRSGLAAKHNIFVMNSPGTIDRDYCGPDDVIKVILHMAADTSADKLPDLGAIYKRGDGKEIASWGFKISTGDRIAQMLLTPTYIPTFNIHKEHFFLEDGKVIVNRDGLGSTGLN